MKKKIVFLTGAGIDKESGINTFRDTGGTWEGHDVTEVASIEGWKKDRGKILDFYNQRKDQLNTVEPNLAHKLIGDLEKYYDICVITQNVSNLHERGGSTNVIHLHGELTKMCSSLNKTKTLPYINDIKIGDKHEDGSQLRPFIVWFGENVPLIDDAISEIRQADILVIVGTSLEVYPAAGLMRYVNTDCKSYYIDPNPKEEDDSSWLLYFTVISKIATEGMKELYNILVSNEQIS